MNADVGPLAEGRKAGPARFVFRVIKGE